ncbi:helix-turn-helix domain-containing protein [Paenibacillus sp. PK3_47]|uniref:helix-turn-helix domain-containing protein n=1 Tax=Paenibacillus sp. PK3_47 TaxID=2072642 RepID=UPI00201D7811|nr:helix-turn-helix domain-containing protein [Paenibacillus sp. PK3_47]
MDYMISPYPIRIIDPKVESSRLRLQSIRVGQAGHLPGRTLYRSGAVFEHWAMVYIASGSGTLTENGGKEQQVGGGSLFFFRPGYSYCFGPPPEGSWDEYYIDFTGTRVTEWVEAGMVTGGTVYQIGQPPGLLSSFEEVLRLMDSGIPAAADRAALILENMLLECTLAAAAPSHSRESDLMQTVRDDLGTCVYGEVTLAEIAARHHMSMSTLRRIVRRSSGFPLHEYIHRIKMAEAKHLLLNTSLQIKEIAGLLHYSDAFYFSRLYKKYMGISPQYSRNHIL